METVCAPAWARRSVGCLVGSAWLFQALFAVADPLPEDKEAVLSAYREGRALVDAGRVEEGCAAFERAKRLDPTAINLLLNLADCHAALGHTATAWNQLTEVAALARAAADPRAAEATRRAQALAPRLARLRIDVPPTSRVPGLVVTRRGAPVPEALFGVATPLDPGSVRVVAEAPGRASFERTVQLGPEGSVTPVVIPPLAEEAAHAPAAMPPRETPPPAPLGAQRTAALVTAGLGAVGLAVGTVYGLRAMDRQDASNAGPCDGQNRCDAEGLALRAEALDAASVSTLAFAVGAGALGLGVILWTTAPPDAAAPAGAVQATLAPTPDGASVRLGGAF